MMHPESPKKERKHPIRGIIFTVMCACSLIYNLQRDPLTDETNHFHRPIDIPYYAKQFRNNAIWSGVGCIVGVLYTVSQFRDAPASRPPRQKSKHV